jgi:hypothetical protein
MIDAVDLAGNLILGGLVAAYLIHLRSSAKAIRRKRAGIEHQSCARCGDALISSEGAGPGRMCGNCARSLRRSYRAAGWCCAAFAVFFGLAAPFIVVPEYHQFGLSTALKDSALFAVMVGLGASLARAFRGARRELE